MTCIAPQATAIHQPVSVDQTFSWEHLARCRTETIPAGLFFSEDLSEIAQAKNICATCPVMAPCLEAAVRNAEPCGVWGGQLFLNGRMLTIKRRRGRPRKHPRPEDQIPQIPVPEHLRELVRTA